MSNQDYFSFDNFRLSQSINLNEFVSQYGLNNSINNVNNRYNLSSFNDFSNQLEVDINNNNNNINHQHHNNSHTTTTSQLHSTSPTQQQQQLQQQQLLQLLSNNSNHISPLLSSANINQIQQTSLQNNHQQPHHYEIGSSPLLQANISVQQLQQQQQLQQLILQQQQQQLLQQQQQQIIQQQQQEELLKLSQQMQLMDQIFITGDISTELLELHSSLEILSQESIQHLFFLCKAIQPQLSEDVRFQLLSKMFTDIPQLIPQLSITNYQTFLQDPSNHALKLFMDFKQLANLFAKISYIQLHHLTNNIIPPGTPQSQFTFFIKIQEYFNNISFDRLRIFNAALGGDTNLCNTSLHVQRLLSLDPNIPIDMIHFVAGIVSLPLGDLYQFHHWFSNLQRKLLAILLAILQLDSSTVLDLKRILATNVPYINDNITNITNNLNNLNKIPQVKIEQPTVSSSIFPTIDSLSTSNLNSASMASMNIDSPISPVQNFEIPSPVHQYQTPSSPIQTSVSIKSNEIKPQTTSTTTTTTSTTSTTSTTTNINNNNNNNNNNNDNESKGYYLKIARQPPSSTVYQRILKPFPQVMICGPGVENENLSNFYVEATLLRNDDQTELVNCIDGTKTSRFSSGVFAPFKKLKILSTTQQQRTLFRLRFSLKRYVRNESQSFPEAIVLSDPIEVFSHTIYLTDKQDVPLPPTVQEIIPAVARAGTRVVVLGANFSNGNDLKVYFGNTSVAATFYEKGTIICAVPPNVNPSNSVTIKVTNDGNQYSNESNVIFNYIP